MYLEPTATVNLGLLLFFAQEDIRYIPKVELKISNPNGELIALLSTENVKKASVEVEFSLCHCGFRAKVVLDEEHWDEFIMTFFQDEPLCTSSKNVFYSYKNESAYSWCEGYGAVQEQADGTEYVVDDYD